MAARVRSNSANTPAATSRSPTRPLRCKSASRPERSVRNFISAHLVVFCIRAGDNTARHTLADNVRHRALNGGRTPDLVVPVLNEIELFLHVGFGHHIAVPR